MQTNMIIRQTLRLGTTVQRMNPKRNATVFKRVYPPKRLPGKIFSTFSFSDSFTRTQYIDIFFVFQTMCCQSVTFVCLSIYFQFKSFDSFLLEYQTPRKMSILKNGYMGILSRCRWFGSEQRYLHPSSELLYVGFCNVQFASVFLTSLRFL